MSWSNSLPEYRQIWVSPNGSDNYNGLSISTPKKTLGAAYSLLLPSGNGGQARHQGRINLDAGEYGEDSPLEWNQGITLQGAGRANGGGTRIHAAFVPSPGFTDYGHYLQMRDLIIDGGFVVIRQGGFGCGFWNVDFNNGSSDAYMVQFPQGANTVFFYECNVSDAHGGWIYYNLTGGANLHYLTIRGGQIDRGGVIPIQIVGDTDGSNHIIIDSVKLEDNAGTYHDVCIDYNPLSGANGAFLDIRNIHAWRDGGHPQASAVFRVRAGAGAGARYNLKNITKDNYATSYRNIKSNEGIAGRIVSYSYEYLSDNVLGIPTSPSP